MAEGLTPLETFTFFPLLPEELRIQIFEEFISQSPRIIEVCQIQPQKEGGQIHHDDSDDDTEPEANQEPTSKPPSDDLTAQNLSLAAIETENNSQEVEENNVASSSSSSSSSSSDSNSAPSPEEEEEEEVPTPPNPNPFYTSTPIPALLHTSRLARSVALQHYTLSFPNTPFHHPKIYYNPLLDTLYFPTWSFPYRLTSFEDTLSPEVKDAITRMAIDNLMWFSDWDEGSLNCTFQIDQFKNLEEVVLVSRGKGNECGCCMEFDGPEDGVVGFEEIEVKGKQYEERCLEGCRVKLGIIGERDPRWNMPRVRFAKLLRDEVLV